jgi:hypothetical protein
LHFLKLDFQRIFIDDASQIQEIKRKKSSRAQNGSNQGQNTQSGIIL